MDSFWQLKKNKKYSWLIANMKEYQKKKNPRKF